MSSCKILDSQDQRIVAKKSQKETAVFRTKEWEIIVSDAILKSIDTPTISPYAFLYSQYKAREKEKQLWIFVAKEHLFLTIFHNGVPFLSDSCKKEELVSCIESFLRKYYESEGSDFIEGVMLYSVEPLEENLEEQLLLPIEVIKIELDEICKKTDLLYRPKSKPNYLLIASLLLLFSLLVGYDLYLKYSLHQTKEQVKVMIDKEIELVNQKNDYDSQLMKLGIIKPVVSDLLSHNELLMQKLHSIFDLVPDDTYLTKFVLAQKEVFIEGVAQNIDRVKNTLYKELSSFYSSHKLVVKRGKEGYLFTMVFKE